MCPKTTTGDFRPVRIPLVLSAAAGRIKGSRWHPQTAHHIALRLATTPLSPVGCAWCGEKRQYHRNRRWGKIGGGKWGMSELGTIPRPLSSTEPGPWKPNISHPETKTMAVTDSASCYICLDDGPDEAGKPLVRATAPAVGIRRASPISILHHLSMPIRRANRRPTRT